MMKEVIAKLKKMGQTLSQLTPKLKTKKGLTTALTVILVIAAGVFVKIKYFKPAPKKVYEVAVMVRSQHASDPAEDARTSLKKGDVVVVQPEGHSWSRTEKISYLILKMKLSEEEKAKLTQPEEREIKFKELPAEEQKRIEEEKKRAKAEGREYTPEPRRETLRARAYRINLEKYFPNLKPINLLKGQPYLDKVYGWEIVKKKKPLKKKFLGIF